MFFFWFAWQMEKTKAMMPHVAQVIDPIFDSMWTENYENLG